MKSDRGFNYCNRPLDPPLPIRYGPINHIGTHKIYTKTETKTLNPQLEGRGIGRKY